MSTGVVGGGREPGCYASIWTVETHSLVRALYFYARHLALGSARIHDEKNQTSVYAISWKFDYTISATFVSTNVAEI